MRCQPIAGASNQDGTLSPVLTPCDGVGEIRAILENLVPVLAKAGGEHAGMGKVVGFRSGCGEWIVETSQKPHVYH